MNRMEKFMGEVIEVKEVIASFEVRDNGPYMMN